LAELTIGQLIKIILGILVVVAVSIGVYIVFQNQIFDFFKGLSAGNVTEMFMVFIK
jgi:hypothetical protein